jgi:hypothetical protein
LKIGFFHWLLNFILNNWSAAHAHTRPPTANEIEAILKNRCSGSDFDHWRGVINTIKRANRKSLERALQILWPFRLNGDSMDLSSNESLMTMGQSTLLRVSAENLLNLIDCRRRFLTYEDMNTHIVRVMSMIGRDRHLTSEEARSVKALVDVPGTNNKLGDYDLDDPTKHKRYIDIKNELFGKDAPSKNTLVPPMYCLIHRALCRLNAAIKFFENKCLGDMDMNSRHLQSAKLDLIAYLEQVGTHQ